MLCHRTIKSLVIALLLGLLLSRCQSPVEFPASTASPVVAVASPTNTLVATPVPQTAVTPSLLPTSDALASTLITPPTTTTTATTVATAIPTIDIRNLGLLVFNQQKNTIGLLSPDGRLFQPLNQVPKISPATLEHGLIAEDSGYYVSPDGRWLTTIVGFERLVLVDLMTDQRSDVAQIGLGAWLGWSPDSQSFAYRQGESTVCIYRLTEQTVDCGVEFEGRVVDGAWSPDGGHLALSVAGQPDKDSPDSINGTVWVVDVASRQTQLIANQDLPVGGVSNLLVWMVEGLIVNRLLNGVAALFAEGSSTPLSANAVSGSPSGNYVVYEDGRVEKVGDGELPTRLPPCAEGQRRTIQVVWSRDESAFAYTVNCEPDGDTRLGIVGLADHDLSWSRAISDNLSLIGWSPVGGYLFFRHEPDDPQQGYKVERMAIDPNGAFETVADWTFLIDILESN